jgi:uncharacterized protein YuzE
MYDAYAEAAYVNVSLGEMRRVARTREIEPGINIDYAEDGSVLGIEILGVPQPEVLLENIE